VLTLIISVIMAARMVIGEVPPIQKEEEKG
jgi:hypothetical protein